MNGQFEREYRDALDGLRFSDETKARMAESLMAGQEQKPAKRRGARPLRAALIAAALCLALVGTAAAAQYFGVQIVPGTGGDEDADFWMKGGIAYYPVDSLSEEVAALDDPGYAAKVLNSWDEVEEFIGVDLMNNPVLDAAPVGRVGFRWNGRKSTGRFLVIGSGGLTQIQTMASYKVGEVNILVQGSLFTDRMAEAGETWDWDERIRGYHFMDGAQVEIENYITPSGLEAQIMTVERDGRYPDKCIAACSLNGVPFVLQATVHHFEQKDLADARDAVLQALDGFVL